MKKVVHLNAFAAMKLEKQVRNAKGKKALLQHVKYLRSEQRKLQNDVNVVTTLY